MSIFLSIAAVLLAPGPSPASPPALASTAAVRSLNHEDAARHLPVDLQATVTYFRGFEKTLFIQEGDTGVFVFAATPLRLAPGDVIRVRGTTEDSFNPIIISTGIAFVSHGRLSTPLPVSWADLAEAKYDCRWVRVRGKVAVAEMGKTSGYDITHLVLALDGGLADIVMDSDDPARLKGLAGAEVEVTAVAAEIFDGKMEQTGVRLHVPSFSFVRVLRRSATDRWSLPATPIDQALRGYDVEDRTPWVRVEGTLTYYYQTEIAVLQDGTKSIRVQTSQADRLKLGGRVEAIGVPSVNDGLLTLKLGTLRNTGDSVALKPQPLTYDELASGKHPYDLVSTEGIVVTQVREQTQDVYVISAQGHLFSAILRRPYSYVWPLPAQRPPVPQLRPGSRVRVTGVASLESGNPYNGPVGFNILLRSVDDVAVLARAPWLNVRNLLGLVSVLLLVVLAIISWVALLRRKVHRQTAALATRIEAEAIRERRRSQILEDVAGTSPLREIFDKIAALVSFNLNGCSCWLQVADGAPHGAKPEDGSGFQILHQEICSPSGPLHGTIYAALGRASGESASASEALSMGARLATLAIETRGLYSDLTHRSEFDLLTDVYNRFSLEKQLGSVLVDALAHKSSFGLVYIDLDEFKQVNDRFGHRIGDLYLQQAADRMKRQLRPGDMLARLGGDEFAALVPRVRSRADVEEIALRLDRCFDEPFALDGYSLLGRASIGVAVFPEDGDSKDALLGAADSAMYLSKRRNRRVHTEFHAGAKN